MAKRKSGWGKTAKVVKPAKGKPPAKSKTAVKRSGKAGTKPGRPKSRTFPEMGDLRIKELDDFASQLADIRHDLNDCQQRENELNEPITRALVAHGKTIWKAHGIELSLVSTGTKLRKRVIKDRSERSSTDAAEEKPAKKSRATGRGKKADAPESATRAKDADDVEAVSELMDQLGGDDVEDISEDIDS